MRIPSPALLWVYLVIPIGLLFLLCDHYVFDGLIRDNLPWTPETIFIYGVLFPLPHILVSFASFADREYLAYYRKRLLIGVPIILLISILLPRYSITLTILTLAFTTIVHVALQQTGIALMLARVKRDLLAACWKYANVLTAITLYMLIFPLPGLPRILSHDNLLMFVVGILSIMVVLTLIVLAKNTSGDRVGRLYFISTAFIPIASGVAIYFHYPFFAILMPRFIHDITAFIFYLTHDHARNRETRHNFFAKFFVGPVAIYISTLVVVAVLISYVVSVNSLFTLESLYFISTLHYFIEAFMWKKGTPHRQALAM